MWRTLTADVSIVTLLKPRFGVKGWYDTFGLFHALRILGLCAGIYNFINQSGLSMWCSQYHINCVPEPIHGTQFRLDQHGNQDWVFNSFSKTTQCKIKPMTTYLANEGTIHKASGATFGILCLRILSSIIRWLWFLYELLMFLTFSSSVHGLWIPPLSWASHDDVFGHSWEPEDQPCQVYRAAEQVYHRSGFQGRQAEVHGAEQHLLHAAQEVWLPAF